jgi:hypothetical protein
VPSGAFPRWPHGRLPAPSPPAYHCAVIVCAAPSARGRHVKYRKTFSRNDPEHTDDNA